MTQTTAAPPSVERWRAETARLVRVSHARAGRAAKRAAAEARRLPPGPLREAGRALSLEARAVTQHAAGRYLAAVRLYGQAVRTLERLGLGREAARVRKNLVDALVYLGRFSEARREGERACRAFERLGDTAGLARALWNLGNLEQHRARSKRALDLYRKARRLFERLGDRENLAHMALNEAVALTALDDFRKAIELFRTARQEWERGGELLLVAQADFDESWVHTLLGDFRRALALLDGARAVFFRAGDTVMVATLDLDRGETLLLLNRAEEAEASLERAIEVFREAGMKLEAGRALTLAAEAAAELGELSRASRRIDRAIRTLETARAGAAVCRAWLARARLALRRGNLDSALRDAAGAERRFAALGLGSSAAAAAVVAAEAHLRRGRADRARTILRRLAARAAGYPAATAARIHHLLGRALLDLGHTQSGYRSVLRALRAIERVRGSVPGTLLRAGWLQDKVEAYHLAMSACLDRGAPEWDRRAFLHAEQARARTLADRVASAPGRARGRAGRSLLARFRAVREEAAWLSGRLAREAEGTAPAGRGSSRTARALARREAELASLLERLEREDETAAQVVSHQGATAEEIAGALEADSVLIEYAVLEGETVAFVLDRERLEVHRLPFGASDLRRPVAELNYQWGRFQFGAAFQERHAREVDDSVQSALARLRAMIFEPFSESVAGRRLLIVPSGPLHEVPFPALPGRKGSLVDQHEITLAPSAAVWRLARRRSRGQRAFRPPLVMGLGAEALPHAPAECAAVRVAMPSARMRIGQDATLAAFRALAPGAAVIHLATHGVFRKDDPLLSAVRLADGPVNLHELYDLDLAAKLVVLSGCKTGLAGAEPGEERIGLARGFLHAGAGAVVVSLWEVSDPSTAAFMGDFHGRIASGVRPSSALRATMTAHRDRYPSPFYWAPFAMVGVD